MKFALILGILILVVFGIDKLDEGLLGHCLKCKTGNFEQSKCSGKKNQNSTQPKQIKTNESKRRRNLGKYLFDNIESFSILVGSILFVLNIPEQHKRSQYEAWQVINSAKGQKGSGGRV